MIKETNTMLEPYKAPTAKTIVVDLKSSYLQAASFGEAGKAGAQGFYYSGDEEEDY